MFVLRTELLVEFQLTCFVRDSGYFLNYTDVPFAHHHSLYLCYWIKVSNTFTIACKVYRQHSKYNLLLKSINWNTLGNVLMAYHIWVVRSLVTTIGFHHKFSEVVQSIMVLLFW